MAGSTPVLLMRGVRVLLTFIRTAGFSKSSYTLTVRSSTRTFPSLQKRTLERFARFSGLEGFKILTLASEHFGTGGKMTTATILMDSLSSAFNRGVFLLYIATHAAECSRRS